MAGHGRSTCSARVTLNHLVRVPKAHGPAICVCSRNRPRRIASNTDQPSAYVPSFEVVEHRQPLSLHGRRFLPIRQEQYTRPPTNIPCPSDCPEHSLADLTGVAPPHTAIDSIERGQQIVVVLTDLDR